MHLEQTENPLPTDLPPRSAWLRFFDTFLQEKNIKWMLGLGGLILLASSLMLVTSHWQGYTPLWKSVVIMSYTAILYVLGEIAYRQLALRRTGTSLLAMTVLLIPISFLAVRAVHGTAGAIHHAGIAGLLLANTAFAAVAGRRILRHFLRQDQPTFLASYLTLSLAGAIVPGLPASVAWPVALVLWMIFAAGTVKVSRHVFWLGEEHRLPRIFGFFPILLLGLQFLTLFAFLAPHVPLPWIGFGCVLTAIPVLHTADALTKVFAERTGNLVRPLPWSLVIPLLVGMGLCLAGVCLAWTGFPRTPAAVPTAFLAAVLLAQVARRTQHPGFVWAMWGGIVLGYQSLPVFFQELARLIVHRGAEAVSEAKLPLAFYGLTYLPLLIVATWVAVVCRRRGWDLFARPTRLFVMGLTTVLWAVSLTHAKAMFPVGLAILAMFVVQMIAFREPRVRFGLVAAWVSTSFGFTPFVHQVLGWSITPETSLLVMTFSAGLLLLPDRFLPRWNPGKDESGRLSHPYAIGDVASLLLTLVLCGVWVFHWRMFAAEAIPWLSGLLLCGLLWGHAWRWCEAGLSVFTLLFAGLYGVLMAHHLGVTWPVILSAGTLIAGGLWLASILLHRIPAARISQAFALASERVAGGALAGGLLFYYLPLLGSSLIGSPEEFWWISAAVSVVWAFDAAVRWRSAGWTYLGSGSVLVLTGAFAVSLADPYRAAWDWLPLLWSGVGLLGVLIVPRPFAWTALVEVDEHDEPVDAVRYFLAQPLGRFLIVLFAVLAVGTLPMFLLPARLASLASVVGLFWLAGGWQSAWLRYLALALLNWQVLSGLVQVIQPEINHIFQLSQAALVGLALPLALGAAISRLCWNLSSHRPGTSLGEFISFQRLMLLGLTAFGLLMSLKWLPIGLAGGNVFLALVVFVALTADQIWQALRKQEEAHVWAAEGTLAVAVAYFLLFGVIRFGSGLSMYAVLITGCIAWAAGYLAKGRRKWQIVSNPLLITGYALPAVTVAMGIIRHLTVPHSQWLGMNSLALLLAGGFYFWRGIEEQRKTWLLSAAGILNIALALLWRELAWTDPQLFAVPLGISILALVQMLKEEIPQKAHDPLRYLGALVILVSPVFHIMGGSWTHLLTLMIASLAVTLTAMGLRIRALMYTGTGFLVGDLLAMVVRGSIDNPTLLWIAGIIVGLAVIALAAYCEKHREQVLQRLRIMAAKLETWE